MKRSHLVELLVYTIITAAIGLYFSCRNNIRAPPMRERTPPATYPIEPNSLPDYRDRGKEEPRVVFGQRYSLLERT